MASCKEKPPSFFKIFFLEFSSKLRIPPEFVKRNGGMLPQMSLLETGSGKSWDVKIKSVNEDFYLTDGWTEFVKDNRLTPMDFLIFHLLSKSTFRVTIFGVESCPKEPVSRNMNAYPRNYDGQNSQSSGSKDVELLPKMEPQKENYEGNGELRRRKCFPAVIKKHNKYSMDIPRKFGVQTGIERKTEIKLQNTEGNEWVVGIFILRDGRARLTKGWYKFRVENKLGYANKCWFEFDSASANLIVKKESEMRNRSSAWRRGRPSKNHIRSSIPKSCPVLLGKRGRGRPPKRV